MIIDEIMADDETKIKLTDSCEGGASIEEIPSSGLTDRQKMILVARLCVKWQELNKLRSSLGAKIKVLAKELRRQI